MAVVPDLNKLTSDNDLGWTIYFTLCEVTKALVLFKLVRWTALRWSALVWFLTQSVDEVTGRNVWPEDGPLEYILFTALVAVTWIMHKKQNG